MFDADAARFFARQHGLITREQAGAPHLIDHRVGIGRWVRVGAGVYRLAGVPVTWRQRALAACLVAGPGAVVSHRAAGVLLGVSGFRPGPLDITVPPGRNNRNPLATVHRSQLQAHDRTTKDRIPVTPPARMLADLARVVSPAALTEAVDDVLCRRLVSLDRLRRAERQPKVLRTILDAWNGHGEPQTMAEMRLVRALLDEGLPPPVRQLWIPEAAARVDLAYPQDRLAIELDSFRWHAGRRPFDADRVRHNRLVAAGYQVLHATPTTVGATAKAAAALVLGRVA